MWRLRITEFLDNPEFCTLTPGSKFLQSPPPILIAERGPAELTHRPHHSCIPSTGAPAGVGGP